tara:strand:+ start:188 stop:445 length:258 start_codon:yes stop_codon:yes gene_type:complete
MRAEELVEGELYVLAEYSSDRCSPIYKREYAGKSVVYMGFEPEYMEHYGETSMRYKLLVNGQLRHMPVEFLRHLQKILDNPFEPC